MSEGALVLADGTTFIGTAVGATGTATGEVVFNTAMLGYQEIATDPSYAGQIITMTAPHIGNYGTNQEDEQADRTWCSGFVVRSISRRASSWRSEGSFQSWLTDRGIVGIADIDTRRLTRHIRSFGAMPAAIGSNVSVDELRVAAQTAPTMGGRDLTETVTTDQPYRVAPTHTARGRVVAIDFGIKRDIIRSLVQRGLEVEVVPSGTPAGDILGLNPNGVFLSNGPGDPAPVAGATATVRTLLGHVPVFGICLGHQILGRALGAATYKLPFGHHGGNHPVRRVKDGRVAITAQNHGFAVDLRPLSESAPPSSYEEYGAPPGAPASTPTPYGPVVATHQNLNDGTLEGFELPDAKAFSVQYHPEAAPGPSDASELFDQFVALMEID